MPGSLSKIFIATHLVVSKVDSLLTVLFIIESRTLSIIRLDVSKENSINYSESSSTSMPYRGSLTSFTSSFRFLRIDYISEL